jgi:uncharacterized protein (DUF433 family)
MDGKRLTVASATLTKGEAGEREIRVAYPSNLASTLSGATIRQLSYWRRSNVLIPEIEPSRPRVLYSFRDVVALRTVVKLRSNVSLQKVRIALRTLGDLDLTEHLSTYSLVSDGDTVVLVEESRPPVDLVRQRGQQWILRLKDLFDEFETKSGARVVSLVHPRPHLEVREQRLSGWPTILGTRVPYDAVALMAEGGTTAERVQYFYPQATREAIADAVDLHREVTRRVA